MDKVVVIAGPTACGKSAFALKLAQEKDGVILNGDSLQVYHGLEILTAQPSLEVQKKVPHLLYGILEPSESCSAGRWLPLALIEIEKTHREGKVPFVVGGTGLYLKALLEGISLIPAIDPHFRKDLQMRDQETLYQELRSIDSTLAARISPSDRQRTLRGLEVFYGTGKPLSYWRSQKSSPLPYKFEKILIMPPKEELKSRIKSRIEEMFQKGVVEEVAAVLSRSPSSNAMKAIGMRELGSFLKGKLSLEETKELVLLHTVQYAKRQRTWFRHQFKAEVVLESIDSKLL